METLGNKIQQNSANKFHCIVCDYSTSRKCNYDSHLLSRKHSKIAELDTYGNKIQQIQQKFSEIDFTCNFCDKSFKNRSGLWKHNKKCKPSSNIITTELVIELIKDNKELKNIIFEQNNTINNMVKNNINTNALTNNTTNNSHNSHNSHNTTNSHNNAFNLNFFLNETCKDAMNISEFVSSIKVSLSDLENTGRQGYVEGISNIILKNLNNMEDNYRPIHCSDQKREVIYIRDNNEWAKETEEKPILTKAIKVIANENIKQIKHWRDKYPGCTESDSKKNDLYLKIVSNSMNGLTEEESKRNISKIISNVSKETVIQKDNY